MFILDSLFVSGLRWVLDKVATAAEAELNDDAALREQLLAAEMRREMGEISDAEFAQIEADLLARIREIRERREGGAGPIAFGRDQGGADSELQVEATVSGDFHEPVSGGSGSAVAVSESPDGGARRRRKPPSARPARRAESPSSRRSPSARARRSSR